MGLELKTGSAVTDSRKQSAEAIADAAVFERASQRYLQMSAEEFVEKWKSGFLSSTRNSRTKRLTLRCYCRY